MTAWHSQVPITETIFPIMGKLVSHNGNYLHEFCFTLPINIATATW
jgi:hypothetical protein